MFHVDTGLSIPTRVFAVSQREIFGGDGDINFITSFVDNLLAQFLYIYVQQKTCEEVKAKFPPSTIECRT